MASASVGLPVIRSCQWSTGTWLVISVAPRAVAILGEFQQVALLFQAERLEAPVIQNEQLHRTEGAHQPSMPAVAAGQAEFGEQPRHPLVEHGVIVAAGLLAEGAGQPGLPDAGRALDDQVLPGLDPAALGKLLEQGAVEAAAGPPVDVLDAGLVAQLGEPQPGLEPAVVLLGDLASSSRPSHSAGASSPPCGLACNSSKARAMPARPSWWSWSRVGWVSKAGSPQW